LFLVTGFLSGDNYLYPGLGVYPNALPGLNCRGGSPLADQKWYSGKTLKAMKVAFFIFHYMTDFS